ncbi:hypothetical protein ACLOJK_039451 [Asimina triloba]
MGRTRCFGILETWEFNGWSFVDDAEKRNFIENLGFEYVVAFGRLEAIPTRKRHRLQNERLGSSSTLQVQTSVKDKADQRCRTVKFTNRYRPNALSVVTRDVLDFFSGPINVRQSSEARHGINKSLGPLQFHSPHIHGCSALPPSAFTPLSPRLTPTLIEGMKGSLFSNVNKLFLLHLVFLFLMCDFRAREFWLLMSHNWVVHLDCDMIAPAIQ